MTGEIVRIPFHGEHILAVDGDGGPEVFLRPIIESIGVDFATQLTKLKTRSWACVGITRMQLPGDTQVRQHVVVNVSTLLMLLATINETKVAPEVRDLLVAYQRESMDAIHDYWTKGRTENPRMILHGAEPHARSLNDDSHTRRTQAAQEKFRAIDSMPVSDELKQQLALHVWADYSGMPVPEIPAPAPAVGAVVTPVPAPPPDPALELVRRWVEEVCEPDPAGTRGSELYEAFVDWCRAQGVPTGEQPTMTRVGRRLNDLGYSARRRAGFQYRPVRTMRHG